MVSALINVYMRKMCFKQKSIIPGFGISFGIMMVILSFIVIIPLATLVVYTGGISITHLTVTNGWIGSLFAKFGIKIAYTRLGITIALIFIGIPFVVRSVQPVLEKMDQEYEQAAEMLGAGKYGFFGR